MSFDGTKTITVNTIGKTHNRDITVTIRAQNTYDTEVIIASKFQWRSCDIATPSNNGVVNDASSTLSTLPLLDYQTNTWTDTTMIVNAFTFTEEYCHVNFYKFICFDPDGLKYTV